MNCDRNCNNCDKGLGKDKNKVNYSITMAGVSSCSGSCVYCSAGTTLNYAMGVNKANVEDSLKKIDDSTFAEFKADFPKLEESLEHNTRFIKAKKLQEKGKQAEVHIDIWGGDPVTCHQATIETVDFLEDFFINKHGMKLDISSSTNGLPLLRNDVCDFYREHNVKLQISHDGCGQWMRTGEIDPLYTPGYAENIAALFREGILCMINDCLNFYNGSVFANWKYFNDYFKSIKMPTELYKKLYIKLNRIYDGQYDIHKKNVKGIFGSDKREWKELANTEFGNMNHHNWKNANTGNIELDHLLAHELDDYMNEWLRLALMMRDPNVQNDIFWQPYRSYINGQINRWQIIKSKDESVGMCRKYQRTVHELGDPNKWLPKNDQGVVENFVLDTLGGYCECNLIDSEHETKNPGGMYEPEACQICKYKMQAECNGCGTEDINPDCEWRYRWVQLLENVKYYDKILATVKKTGYDNGMKEGFGKGRDSLKKEIGNNFVEYLINKKGK